MIQRRHSLFLLTLLSLGLTLVHPVSASETITLIHYSDLHGNLVPHAGEVKNRDGSELRVVQAGGLAKSKTIIDGIRADNPNTLLMSVGDATHGSAETLFTAGDAIMPGLNAMGIDVFVPGNWDFGWGPAVFRHRFAKSPMKPPMPENLKVLIGAYDGPGVSIAKFPTIAANLYNNATGTPMPKFAHNRRVLPPYKIIELGGTKVGVIGLTSSMVPQQARAFNISFTFTQGTRELPGLIEEVKSKGAELIVVMSELGLPQNIEIGKRFDGIHVILSAHTHEITHDALEVNAEGVSSRMGGETHSYQAGDTLVVEVEDIVIGRLDLTIDDGALSSFKWNTIVVGDDVAENPEIKALVDHAEEPFIAGADGEVVPHVILPGGYCASTDAESPCGDLAQRGLQLTEDLDTVVGRTNVVLHRDDALESEANNFVSDALYEIMNSVVPGGVDFSMAGGFRFGVAILSEAATPEGATFYDGRSAGDITLRDLYSLFPIAPAIAVGDFPGDTIQRGLELNLTEIFDRNPFLQSGGWYSGTANMSQEIDLIHLPASTASGRVLAVSIAGEPLDPSKIYRLGSCYPHGDPLGTVCRSKGGSNVRFLALSDARDYTSEIVMKPPLQTENILDGTVIQQVAPDRFLHPVHVMRLYLDGLPDRTVTQESVQKGRIKIVNSTNADFPEIEAPTSSIAENFIQPPEGAGPEF